MIDRSGLQPGWPVWTGFGHCAAGESRDVPECERGSARQHMFPFSFTGALSDEHVH